MAYYMTNKFHFYLDAKKELSASGGFSASGMAYEGALGTSFVPDIDFFPTVLDFFGGYRRKNFDMSGLNEPFLAELTFSGFFVGASVEVPIYNQFTLLAKIKLGPKDTATNSNKLLGEIKSASSRDLEIYLVRAAP